MSAASKNQCQGEQQIPVPAFATEDVITVAAKDMSPIATEDVFSLELYSFKKNVGTSDFLGTLKFI